MRICWLLCCSVLANLAGCAIYNPVQVWRFHGDYNTERQLSAQWVGYDHLPPKTVRMRLTKWAYNVGPSPVKSGVVIPDDSPVDPVTPRPAGVLPGYNSDLLDQSRPPAAVPSEMLLPQPIPGLPPQQLVEPYGPTAQRSAPASHTRAAPARPVTQASWMFAAP